MSLSPQQSATLAQLRDIATPDTISPNTAYWPWLLYGACLVSVTLSIALFLRRRRYPWRGAALAELRRIAALSAGQRALPLQQLLRRLARPGDAMAARAQGEAWKALLNRQWRTDLFSRATWLDGLYRAPQPQVSDSEMAALYRLLAQRSRWPW
ncbi:DUF4381 domain-containing protein [Granulosicoccaceae sp. 1_MG-2023]|nr:DUF4381 domain-containing protein [Granulosicoccaceae sp. 1_MG-2023]